MEVEVHPLKLGRKKKKKPVPKNKIRSIVISFSMPVDMLGEIKQIVGEGCFPSRSEFIRTAITLLLTEIRKTREALGAEKLEEGAGG